MLGYGGVYLLIGDGLMDVETKTETVYEDKPWALQPLEGVSCPCIVKRCNATTIEQKQNCMWNGCPYDVEGDDGFT